MTRLRRRLRGEDGAVAIEYVLWLPVLLLVLTLTTDAALLLHQRSQFHAAARDLSRLVSVGAATPGEAMARADQSFGAISGFQRSVTEADGFVTTRLSAPFESLTRFSGRFVGASIGASVTMYIEAPVPAGS